MTSNELLYVTTVAEEKSFSKAAEKLYISQPSLSQAIMRIEKQYGCQFFVRNAKGFSITQAGEVYIRHARIILQTNQLMENELKAYSGLSKNELVIGMLHNQGNYFVPHTLTLFQTKFPDIQVKAIETQYKDLEEGLLNGSFDFIITNLPVLSPGIETITIGSDRFMLMMNKDNPLANHSYQKDEFKFPYLDLRRAENETHILFPRTEHLRILTDMIFDKAGFSPKKTIEIRGLTLHEELCGCSEVVSLVPRPAHNIIGNNENVIYFHIDEDYHVPKTMVVAFREGQRLSAPAKEYINLIKEHNIFKQHSLPTII